MRVRSKSLRQFLLSGESNALLEPVKDGFWDTGARIDILDEFIYIVM